jgi:uncharacterized Zn finger protein
MTFTSTEPMAENAKDLEADHLFGRPLHQCPRCGNRHLETVVEDESREVHFFCSACDRCWRVELGFAQPVAPGVCLRNPARDRREAVPAAPRR